MVKLQPSPNQLHFAVTPPDRTLNDPPPSAVSVTDSSDVRAALLSERRERPDHLSFRLYGAKLTPEQRSSYAAVHNELNRKRGPARNYRCEDCGKQAADWSYNGDDPNELLAPPPRGRALPMRYRPMAPRLVPVVMLALAPMAAVTIVAPATSSAQR